MRDFGESLCVYKPPINTKTVAPVIDEVGKGAKQVVLNWITPHQKWGIHSTYSENLLLLTLSRGGPCVWMSEVDAAKIDCEDNDWIELYNTNGAIAARAVVSQRVPEGMVMMYHAQEKIVNTPISQITGHRGGIHNSVTRAVVKPTHMIGGYAQSSWWSRNWTMSSGTLPKPAQLNRRWHHESQSADRHGPEPGQVHWLPHLLGDL
jgi:nitrate reductase alpha subunit